MSDTMGQILRNRSLVLSVFIAVALIGGSLYISRNPSAPVAQASAESALLNAIATRDSDGDGLPDWQEALYGTDPHTIDTQKLGMSDAEAVAKGLIVPKAVADISAPGDSSSSPEDPFSDGTLTSLFAQHLLSVYATAKEAKGGGDLTEEEISAVVQTAVSEMAGTFAKSPDYKGPGDIAVIATTPDSLRAYATAAESIIKKNTAPVTMSEIDYLQKLVMEKDGSAAGNISQIARAYRMTAAGFAVLPVPSEIASSHLAFVNSMMRLAQIDADFAREESDPLAAILALQQYQTVVRNVAVSLANIGTTYVNKNILPQKGNEGAYFIELTTSTVVQTGRSNLP